MLADLHTHSTASDGQHAPAALVRLARAQGLQLLALTDHDTLSGLPEAQAAGSAEGVRVLPGVELSARERRSFHILGYAFGPRPAPLLRLCAWMQEGREERKFRILEFLREKGVPLELEEVEAVAGGSILARPHFARALVRRGYAASVQEAFDRWLATEEFARIKRPKPSARDCIEAIRDSGGRAVLAHPYQLRLDDAALEAQTAQLAGWGLEGLECFYPRHSPAQTAFYLRLAEKYGLRPTGGSDFHGLEIKPDIPLARLELDVDWLLT